MVGTTVMVIMYIMGIDIMVVTTIIMDIDIMEIKDIVHNMDNMDIIEMPIIIINTEEDSKTIP